MDAGRLLVVGDEYYATLAAVRGLRTAGYEPWLAATTDDSLAARSRSVAGVHRVPHPSRGAEAFVEAVRDAASSCGAAAVLPGTEPALAALADRDIGVPTGAPSAERLARATDKEQLAAAGLRVPPSVRVRAPAAEAPDVTFPAIVKPARSTVEGEDGTIDLPPARRVASRDELAAALAELPRGEYLVQPHLAGELVAVAGVAWEGALLCLSQQVARRVQPPGAGASAYAESVPVDPVLRRGVERLVASLAWSGLFELQLLDGHALDFNPRFYGSMQLAIAAGLNLPAIWADLLTGRAPRIGTYRAGIRYRAEARDVRLLARALSERDVRGAFAIARPRARTTHAVFSVRDPRPFGLLVRRLRSGDRRQER